MQTLGFYADLFDVFFLPVGTATQMLDHQRWWGQYSSPAEIWRPSRDKLKQALRTLVILQTSLQIIYDYI